MEKPFRRKLPYPEFTQQNIDISQGSPGNMMRILRQKIRNQAQRLMILEQYKSVCEQRIQDLQPGHPLPVLAQHIGSTPIKNIQQELSVAKNKINQLENELSTASVPLTESYVFPHPKTQLNLIQLQNLYSCIYFSLHQMIKDKNSLQESLRAQMLQNEEQRNYIQVLKQALESKFKQQGFLGSVQDYIIGKFSQNKQTENEVNFQDQLQEKQQQIQVLVKERQMMDRHLQEAAQALQYAEFEVKRLQEQKTSLLDYIEQQDQQKLKQKIKQKMQEAFQEIDKLIAKKQELESKILRLKSKERTRQSNNKEFEDLKKQLKAVIDKKNSILQRNQSLEANLATLSDTLLQTKRELEQSKTANKELEILSKALKQSLENSKNQIQIRKSTENSIKNKVLELQQELLQKQKDFRQRKQKIKSKKEGLLRESNQTISRLQSELNSIRNSQEEFLTKEKK